MTLFRCVDAPEQARSHYLDTGGPVAYIEVTVAKAPKAMKACYNLLRDRIGSFCTHICWVRAKYNDRFSMVTLNDAARHLTYG